MRLIYEEDGIKNILSIIKPVLGDPHHASQALCASSRCGRADGDGLQQSL